MIHFRKRDARTDNGPGEFHQSAAYHRYFEGWAEQEVLTSGGKVKINRVYVSDYHCVALPRGKWILTRISLWCVLLLSALVFVIGSVQDTVSNQNPLVAVLQVVVAGGYLAMFFSLGSLRTRMTIYEYKAGPRALQKAGMITAAICALCFLSACVISVMQRISWGTREAVTAICFGGACFCSAAIAFSAGKIPLSVERNETEVPDGSVIIRKAGE